LGDVYVRTLGRGLSNLGLNPSDSIDLNNWQKDKKMVMKRHHRQLIQDAWDIMETAERLNKEIKFDATGFLSLTEASLTTWKK